MHKIGFFERIFYFTAHKIVLALFSLIVLVLLATPLSNVEKKSNSLRENIFNVEFSNFSPAFAALEDEFLFPETNDFLLQSGLENVDYAPKGSVNLVKNAVSIEELSLRSTRFDSLSFDGSKTLAQDKNLKNIKPTANKKTLAAKVNAKGFSGELGFGSLVAMVNGLPEESKPISQNQVAPPALKNTEQNQPDNKKGGLNEKKIHEEPVPIPEIINVSGSVSLKEGIAYFGDMDIGWIVGDEERARGSINAKDATYSIDIKDNVGEIVISLYDNKNELIGEGFADVTQAKIINSEMKINIDIFPINWDRAGRVIDASTLGLESFGAYKQKNLKNVLIELYAFEEGTESIKNGEFSFYNWKKSNSRSLALASKKGYKDSLFVLDSKREERVLLFSEDYIRSFYSYLNDLGLKNIAGKGTIYGNIMGSKAQGYSVRIEKQKPIYFFLSGLADLSQKSTSDNGLFAFVGLSRGEYDLIIEKNGVVVDRKIVLVEEDRISPLVIDLSLQEKHLEFFNPLNPDEKISRVNAFFFDGETKLTFNSNNETFLSTNSSSQPSILDYEGEGVSETSRTFVSQNKGMQRIPLLQDETILKLAVSKNMDIKKGLIIGFISSPMAYHVSMKESPVEAIFYFNEKGEEILNDSMIPYGFIMGGFPKGLSSVIISRNSDNMILATDLIFSDHDSISIVNSSISAVDN